jgi:hypothetical protein
MRGPLPASRHDTLNRSSASTRRRRRRAVTRPAGSAPSADGAGDTDAGAQHAAATPIDALGRVERSACVFELPVLGIPTRFETNDPALGDLIERTFGRWRTLVPHVGGEGPRSLVRMLVEAGDEGGGRAPLRYRVAAGGRVFLTTPGSLGVVEPARREVQAWVTRALVDDTQHFRHGVLEGLTIALLSRLDRQPVHAAAIARDGVALLLAGPSGAGKSTLTYAAARAGLDVLAEDVVYVQLDPRLRIWGATPFLHLPPDALGNFEELHGAATVVLANGKEKLVVDLRERGRLADPPFVEHAAVCLLRRSGAARPSLEEIAAADVAAALGDRLEPGFDLFADTIAPVHHALAAAGGWILDAGSPPEASIPLIHSMLDRIAQTNRTR